jgi:hypothetical protein
MGPRAADILRNSKKMDVSHQIQNILNKNKWTADILTCPTDYMFFFKIMGPRVVNSCKKILPE